MSTLVQTNPVNLLYTSIQNNIVPVEFQYKIMLDACAPLLNCLWMLYPTNTVVHDPNFSHKNYANVYSPGYYTFGDIPVWIDVIQSMSTKNPEAGYLICFHSQEDSIKLNEYILKQLNTKEIKSVYKMYRFDTYDSWQFDQDYLPKKESDLIGLQSVIQSLDDDMKIMKDEQANTFLTSKGLHHSLNYVLYGGVGTGKSSMIQVFCTKYQLPIFRVSSSILDGDVRSLSTIMNAIHNMAFNKDTIRVVVVEDFDRWFASYSNSDISELLNTLDGLKSVSHVIRFFTANDFNKMKVNIALWSRITRSFAFGHPGHLLYKLKLENMLSYWTEKRGMVLKPREIRLVDDLCKLANKKHVSVRKFESFIIRNLFFDDWAQRMDDQKMYLEKDV